MWVAYVVGNEQYVHEIPDLPTDRGLARSNNIAEYRALILLLRRIRQLVASRPRQRYTVHGDSQLVVYQITGRYRVQDPKLIPLHEDAVRIAAELPVTFRWVPRAENRAGHLLD